MKFRLRLTKKQQTWGLTIFLVVIASLIVYSLFFKSSGIAKNLNSLFRSMMSVVYGVIIAYVLSAVVNFIEAKLLAPLFAENKIYPDPKTNPRAFYRMRRISMTLTMLLVAAIFYLLIALVVPQLYASVVEIVNNFPQYVNNIYRWINTLLAEQPDLRRTGIYITSTYSTRINAYFDDTLMPFLTSTMQSVPRVVANAAIGLLNFFIGFIVAIYVLYSKESFCARGKKMAYAFFKETAANEIIAAFRFAHDTFNGFIVGKIVDSLIVGVICYVATLLMRLPYPILISVIVAITNLIPFFGPYIGGILSAVLLVMIRPLYALIFLIFIICLQLVDGNIIGPRILGNTTGLSGFWVIFSIVFFGALWGVVGWLIGVPLFALCYAFVKRLVDERLAKRGLIVDTTDYLDLAYIEGGKYKKMGDADAVKYNAQKRASNWKRVFRNKNRAAARPLDTQKKEN